MKSACKRIFIQFQMTKFSPSLKLFSDLNESFVNFDANEEWIYLLQSLLTGKSPVGLEQRNPSEFGAVLHVCEVAVIVYESQIGNRGKKFVKILRPYRLLCLAIFSSKGGRFTGQLTWFGFCQCNLNRDILVCSLFVVSLTPSWYSRLALLELLVGDGSFTSVT